MLRYEGLLRFRVTLVRRVDCLRFRQICFFRILYPGNYCSVFLWNMLFVYRTARCHNPEYYIVNIYIPENLNFCILGGLVTKLH
jgi:hypothetical protein